MTVFPHRVYAGRSTALHEAMGDARVEPGHGSITTTGITAIGVLLQSKLC